MARILLFSDSHGVFAAMQALRARVEADAPDLVCFLGDALYHGPRNGVPLDYDTKASAEAFNAMAERIVAVRGNCDAEIDQYMLSFPMLGTYATVVADGVRLDLDPQGRLGAVLRASRGPAPGNPPPRGRRNPPRGEPGVTSSAAMAVSIYRPRAASTT